MSKNKDIETLTKFYTQFFEPDSPEKGEEFAQNVLEELNKDINPWTKAELMHKNDYYIIEDAGVEFCAHMIGDGFALATGNVIPAATTFFLTGYNLYGKRIHLKDNEMEFCKYVIKYKYTFSDRMKYMPSGGRGFLLDEAINDFVEFKIKQGSNKSQDELMKETKEVAEELKKLTILKKCKEDGRYFVRF